MYASDDSTAFKVCQYMVWKIFYADTRYCICDIGSVYEYGILFQYNGNIIELFLANYFKSLPNSTRIINFP